MILSWLSHRLATIILPKKRHKIEKTSLSCTECTAHIQSFDIWVFHVLRWCLTLAARHKSKTFHPNGEKCEREVSFQWVTDGVCCCETPSYRLCCGWQVREITCWYRGSTWGNEQAQTGKMADLFESLPGYNIRPTLEHFFIHVYNRSRAQIHQHNPPWH